MEPHKGGGVWEWMKWIEVTVRGRLRRIRSWSEVNEGVVKTGIKVVARLIGKCPR